MDRLVDKLLVGGGGGGGGGDGDSAVAAVLGMAQSDHVFTAAFLGGEHRAFVDFTDLGHRVTCLVNSKTYRRQLALRHYRATGKGLPAEVQSTAILTLEARPFADGYRHPISVRLGELDGRIYIDLGDETWDAIEVDQDDWRRMRNPPVRFARSISALPLPMPVRGASLEPLGELLNVDADGLKICIGWLVSAFSPTGPYPTLVTLGQHGTGKTTLLRILRRLLDPNSADVCSFPPTERDLLVSVQRCWMPLFDNLSSISDELSDALCRMSTGGSMVLRTLFTDSDETVLTALRPVGLSGITEIVTRADLMDRCVFALTQPLTKFVEEKVLWAKVDALAPSLLGALLDVVVAILRLQAEEGPAPLPGEWRMADFVRLLSFAEAALGWPEGAFAEAYAANRRGAILMVVEANPLASALVTFMQETYYAADGTKQTRKKKPWIGTSTDLHPVLANLAGAGAASVPGWPRSPNALGKALPRVVPPLAAIGLQVTTHRTATERTIRLEWDGVPEEAAATAPPRDPKVTPLRPRVKL